MAIETVFEQASSVMTVISFITFAGILCWTWTRRADDLASAALLPFADEEEDGHV